MSNERDRPRPGPVQAKVPSSTYFRFEHISEQVKLAVDRIKALEDRQRVLELENREGLTHSKGEARALRDLLDRVHKELVDLETSIAGHAKRIDEVELADARNEGERRNGALVATGGGAAGGGLLYALIELVKAVLT